MVSSFLGDGGGSDGLDPALVPAIASRFFQKMSFSVQNRKEESHP